MRKFWQRFAMAALVVLCAAAILSFTLRESSTPQELATAAVDSGPVISYIRATGSVSSTRDTRLGMVAGGLVQAVSVSIGSTVQAGQELLQIDTSDIKLQLSMDDSALREIHTDIANQSRIVQGLQADHAAGAVSRDQLLQAQNRLSLLRIQHEKAADRVRQTRTRMQHAILRSPITGMVTDVSVRPGEVAMAGQPMITVADSANQQILARMEQNDARELAVDMPVSVSLDGASGQAVQERIVRIEPAVRKEGNASYTAVWISLHSSALRLRPNQQVDIRVPIGSDKSVVRIPLEALASHDGKMSVWTIDGNGRLQSLPVTLGTMDDQFAEVLSGVSPGLILALAEGRTLREGDPAQAKAPSTP